MACVSAADDFGPHLSKRELARYLGCSTKSIDRWDKKGELPIPGLLPSGHKRWRRIDIDTWFDDRRAMPIPIKTTGPLKAFRDERRKPKGT